MIRVLVPPVGSGSPERVELFDQEDHHLRVRRVADGEPVLGLDGLGSLIRGTLRRHGERLWIEVREIAVSPRPPELRLLIGAGDRDRFFWVVEKATELGVTDLVPLITERVPSVSSRLRDEHRAKLERRALETLKQCGGAWAPVIHPLTELDLAVEATGPTLRWLADREGMPPEPVADDAPAAIIIGPEGGLTEREKGLATERGYRSVRLGSRILRFETAALAALALVASRRSESDA